MLRKGMFLADRYEILDQIGTGGMSDVYKAKCHKLNRFVAIKILKAEFSDDKNFVSKFRIEAQSAAGLTHPNVVNVYDVGDENGIYYIVMELVEGITLKRYIEKKGRLASKEAVSIAIQVAQGIEAAHNHHIIHRDIKPQNVIISKEGKVKVTDFGIARAATTNTINSSAMGSVHYISPEQARGGYSDERSDIYSFGITLYEMLTGIVPFDGDSTVAVAVQHIQDEIAPPSTVADSIPVSVDMIVVKCTQKKTERRYQNVSELIADLKKSLVMPDVDFVKMGAAFVSVPDVTAKTEEPELKTDMVVPSDDEIDLLDDEYDGQYDNDEDSDYEDDLNDDDEEDEDDIEDGGNEKLDKIMKWIGIGIAAIIVIITIFIFIKLGGVFGGKGTENASTSSAATATEASTVDESDLVVVPSVKDKTSDEAIAILKEKGLGYKKVLQPSKTVAKDTVISQSQEAGSKVAKNTMITIMVSDGTSTFAVKNVAGMSEADATAALTASGLIVTVEYPYSDTVAQGNVIKTSPTGGTTVTASDSIVLYVSRGKETKSISMISVTGKTEDAARQALSALGFSNINSAAKAYNATVLAGSVFAQNYEAGKSIASDTEIVLTIATIPDVVGKPKADAKTLLTSNGFKVTEETAKNASVAAGIVYNQEELSAGSVKIYISAGPEPESTTKAAEATTKAN